MYMRVNGVPLAKSARATSWWALLQRRSTNAEEGVQTSADLSAQAVGSEKDVDEETGAGAGLDAEEASGAGSAVAFDDAGAAEGSGRTAPEPPQATSKTARRVRRTVAERS
jgi:hypothetical protein